MYTNAFSSRVRARSSPRKRKSYFLNDKAIHAHANMMEKCKCQRAHEERKREKVEEGNKKMPKSYGQHKNIFVRINWLVCMVNVDITVLVYRRSRLYYYYNSPYRKAKE